jgi:hypothetical protein
MVEHQNGNEAQLDSFLSGRLTNDCFPLNATTLVTTRLNPLLHCSTARKKPNCLKNNHK